VRRRERVILVEGYFDHLAMIEAGLEETVASMGTALTPEQCEKLRRLVTRVVVCYDGDAAGRAATRSALSLLLANGFQAAVARLPEGSDPHDVLGREGPRSLVDRIEGAPDYLTWLLDDLRPDQSGLTSVEKSERTRAVLEIVRAIPDPVLRYEECRRVSRHLAVPLEVLWQSIAPKKEARAAGSSSGPAGTAAARPVLSTAEIPAAERWILQILLSDSECKSLITEGLKDEYVSHPAVRRIVETLRRAESGAEHVDFQRQIAHLTEEDRIFVSGIALEEHPAASAPGVQSALKQLERRYLEREESEIQRAIEQADAGQRSDLRELILRKEEISRRKSKLGRARKWERKEELGD
jgi:DNA primase